MAYLGVIFGIILSVFGALDAHAFCSGCGCRGGPGYRGPDGRCVGFQQLFGVCGVPPAQKCTFEGAGGQKSEDWKDMLKGGVTNPRLQPPASTQPIPGERRI